MKHLVLLLLLASSAVAGESKGPFYSPITGFSTALTPILNDFEKASVETMLRGFIARGDSFPGYRNSNIQPSEYGLYLNVAVRDLEEIKASSDLAGSSDHTEQKSSVTHRVVYVLPPEGGEVGIAIHFDYGSQVPREIIKAVDACIREIIAFSKRSPKHRPRGQD